MPKALCIVGIAVAVLLLLVFALDLAVAIPFGRDNLWMDIGLTVCSIIMGYLGWATLRQQG
jgi:hypothetical protein